MKLSKKSFFTKDTTEVAQRLLGCYLVRKTKKGSILKGKIVETEAYLGLEDSCCHSYKGLYTDRNKAMYLEGGHAYVYFTYGMYHCFNIVTAQKNQPEAVLIRAIEPLKGMEEMKKNRKKTDLKNLTTGPGKLSQAFHITKDLNGINLLYSNQLYLEKGQDTQEEISVDIRVGLSPKKDACYWPLRFFLKNNDYVSIKKNLMK